MNTKTKSEDETGGQFSQVEPYLFERDNGRYYFRASTTQGGKTVEIKKSLKTDKLGVARDRLAPHRDRWQEMLKSGDLARNGSTKMPGLIAAYRTHLETEIKPGSRRQRIPALDRLLRTWPGFTELDPSKILTSHCHDWAENLPKVLTIPPQGSHSEPRRLAPATVNQTINALSQLFQFAKKKRMLIGPNPVREMPRVKVPKKKVELPSREQLEGILIAMRFRDTTKISAFIAQRQAMDKEIGMAPTAIEFALKFGMSVTAVERWRSHYLRGELKVPKDDRYGHAEHVKEFLEAMPVWDRRIKERSNEKSQPRLAEEIGVSIATYRRYLALHRANKLLFSGTSAHEADLACGLAFTGGRLNEVNQLTWKNIKFGENLIHIGGTKSDSAERDALMIPQARALFERLRAARPDEPLTERVFKVRECQNTLTRGCAEVGVQRMTHHDFRHYFITACLETTDAHPRVIAEWVGHKDGGKLILDTYGHVRRDYARKIAAQVVI